MDLRCDNKNSVWVTPGDDSGATAIAQYIRSKNVLHDLIVDPGYLDETTRMGYQEMFDAIESKSNLGHCYVVIYYRPEQDLSVILARMLSRNKAAIQSISLTFYDKGGDDDCLLIINSLINNTVICNVKVRLYNHLNIKPKMIPLGKVLFKLIGRNSILQSLDIMNAYQWKDAMLDLIVSGVVENRTLNTFRIAVATNKGVTELVKIVRYNKSLSTLEIHCQSFHENGLIAIFQALEHNESIVNVNIGDMRKYPTREAVLMRLESLEYNDTLHDLRVNGYIYNTPSYDRVESILRQNRSKTRIASKKYAMKRKVIFEWLLHCLTEWYRRISGLTGL